MLYEVAIIEEPTPERKKEGDLEKILLMPKPIIAVNPEAAANQTIINELDKGTDMSRLRVLVRPFV